MELRILRGCSWTSSGAKGMRSRSLLGQASASCALPTKYGFTVDGCRASGGRRFGDGMSIGCRKRATIQSALLITVGRKPLQGRSSASSFAAQRRSSQHAKPRRAGLSHILAAAAHPSRSPTSSGSLIFPQFPVPTPLATACAARFARGIPSPFPETHPSRHERRWARS